MNILYNFKRKNDKKSNKKQINYKKVSKLVSA